MKNIPSFFVVGAQKAGTTSLHAWLKQQPDVRLPVIKETHFFSHEDKYRRGIEWYQNQFPAGSDGCVTGEIDPEYMFFGGSAQRIKDIVGSPKFIFIFRNPVDRAFSNYQMSLRRGFEDLSFIEALGAEKARLTATNNAFAVKHQSYMARGSYAEQVRRYLEVFPDSEFLFVKFDDMVAEKTGFEVYKKICAFIGIRSSPELADRRKKSNPASISRSGLVRDLLYRPRRTFVRKAISSLLSESSKLKIWVMLDRLNQAPLKKNDSGERREIPDIIKEAVVKDLLDTEKLTGLNLARWAE